MRGFRIEPGEIEAALRQHAGGERSRGGGARGRRGGRALVAYVVGRRRSAALDAAALRAAPARSGCRTTWCRRAIVLLEALPLTRERQGGPGAASPAPEARRRAASTAAPRDARRRRCWRDSGRRCWGVERVGREDNFFDARRALAAGDAAGLARPRQLRGGTAAARRCSSGRRCASWRRRWSSAAAGSSCRRSRPRAGGSGAAAVVCAAAAVVPGAAGAGKAAELQHSGGAAA